MKDFILYLILTVLLFMKSGGSSYDMVIRNIAVIDPVKKEIIPAQTIFIRGETIADVRNTMDVNPDITGTIEIDGSGKFISVGYWNMHTHVSWHPQLDDVLFPVLFSYGITGVRDMGGDLEVLNAFKKKIKEQPGYGPVLFGPGPLIDGAQPIHPDVSVALTQKNCERKLDSLYDQGVDFLKVYSLLPEEIVRRVSEYSSKKKMPFVGHVSEYMTAIEAAKLEMKSFEHLNRIEDLGGNSMALDRFIEEVKTNGSWICPTLIIYKRKRDISRGMDINHPLDTIIDMYLRTEWNTFKERRQTSGSDPEYMQKLESTYELQKSLVRKLYQEDVQLLIGSDFGGMPYIYPGYGLHEEMALLHEIGLSTYDILRMVTYEPARFFEIEADFGSVARSKIADLVILNSNPVLDIKNTRDIEMVIKSGKIVVGSN